jgi:hypothetical protein
LPDALRKEGMLTEAKEVFDLIVMTVIFYLRFNARFRVLLALANIGFTSQGPFYSLLLKRFRLMIHLFYSRLQEPS